MEVETIELQIWDADGVIIKRIPLRLVADVERGVLVARISRADSA